MSRSCRRSARSPTATTRWCWSTTAHATGHLGEKGRGTPALTGAGQRVDIVTGTFGKTLGGGMGGFVAAAQPIVDLLRQRARPYLFSNSLAPPVAAGALKALEIAIEADDRRALLAGARAALPRRHRSRRAFAALPGVTPIIPVMLGEARLAQELATRARRARRLCGGLLLSRGAEGRGAHPHPDVGGADREDVDFAVSAFADAGRALKITMNLTVPTAKAGGGSCSNRGHDARL